MKLYGHTLRAQNGYVRQSYAGIVRQRLISIERDIAAGLRHEGVRQRLQLEGYGASMGTFRKTLSRARIWWRLQLVLAGYGAQQATKTAHEATADAVAPGSSAPSMASVHPPPNAPSNLAQKPSLRGSSLPPKASQGVDLDQFFKPKSVFSKPQKTEGHL